MSTIGSEISSFYTNATAPGPVTRRHLRRSFIVYCAVVAVGMVPALMQASAGWQAAGLGLWAPGAGFVAAGGWTVLLFPVTLALFAVSVIAWFWAGMVLAPLAVWLGAAGFAAWLAPEQVWGLAHGIVAVLMAATAVYVRRKISARHSKDEARAERRRAFLPGSLAEVVERSAAVPDPATREMTPGQLESLRYLLDRALQPVEAFDGFTVIDQFQPAALRYQLNHMGYALGIVQGAYLPNFRGYMHRAQRNLIDKYLLRRVWDYWVYESCWGHLNFANFDPAARDNIMLTGWFGMQVGQYTLSSGDRRYGEPGSLTFRLNDRTSYAHDLHTLVGSVAENYDHYKNDFCIYPCEPNWIYPVCNHYGMVALATHDRLFGTEYRRQILPLWLEKMDTEFTDRSGSIIGLRSQLTGIELPFPSGVASFAKHTNCFAPDRARRLWAIARKELEPAIARDDDGQPRITLRGKGLDAGNYSRGFVFAYAGILTAAREFGDDEIALAAERSLEQDCSPDHSSGSLGYLGGSNLANADAAMGRLMRTGDFRRSFVEGPSDAGLAGPCLTDVAYPDVLVARAYSGGDDLELVLYDGSGPGPQTLAVERLQPNRAYRVSGAVDETIVADSAGSAKLSVDIRGRTELRLTPASG